VADKGEPVSKLRWYGCCISRGEDLLLWILDFRCDQVVSSESGFSEGLSLTYLESSEIGLPSLVDLPYLDRAYRVLVVLYLACSCCVPAFYRPNQ
jgi:hypothetical protein